MKEVLVVLVTCNNKNTSNFWKVGFGKLELLNFCYQLQQRHCVLLEVPLNTLIHKSGELRDSFPGMMSALNQFRAPQSPS